MSAPSIYRLMSLPPSGWSSHQSVATMVPGCPADSDTGAMVTQVTLTFWPTAPENWGPPGPTTGPAGDSHATTATARARVRYLVIDMIGLVRVIWGSLTGRGSSCGRRSEQQEAE